MGGTQTIQRAEPGKQKPRSCRAQELARSSGLRKCAAEKGWLTDLENSRYDEPNCSMYKAQKMWKPWLSPEAERADYGDGVLRPGTDQGAESQASKPRKSDAAWLILLRRGQRANLSQVSRYALRM
jgi:hypothetical protein